MDLRDIEGNTPLFFCTSIKSLHVFLDHGANINAVNSFEETPLFKIKSLKIFKEMVKQGAEISVWNIQPLL